MSLPKVDIDNLLEMKDALLLAEDKIRAELQKEFKNKNAHNETYTMQDEAKMAKNKTSFNELSLNYTKSTNRKDHVYKQTSVYKTLRTTFVNKDGVDPLNPVWDFAKESNVKLAGSTWDVSHLDAFLETSEHATTDTRYQYYQNKKAMSIREGSKGSTKNLSKNLTSEKGVGKTFSSNLTKMNSSILNGSYFFNSKTRMPNNPNIFYDFPSNYKKYNHLTGEIPDAQAMTKFFDNNFSPSKQAAETIQKETSILNTATNVLMMPGERRKEMNLIKQNQKDSNLLKSDKLEKQKKYRVIHGFHRSGIMGIDHPNYQDTLIYQGKDALERQAEEERLKIQERRQVALNRHNGTHPDIVFGNPRSSSRVGESNIERMEKNENPLEHSKKRVPGRLTDFWNESQNRIFGAEFKKYSMNRAQRLFSQETRDRGFSIISHADNSIKLKVDTGENLKEQQQNCQ